MTELRGDLLDDAAPALVLVDTTSEAERRLVEGALPDLGHRPVTVLPLQAGALAAALRHAEPGTLVTAVRVAGVPRRPAEGAERRRRRRRLASAALSSPRRPPRPLQGAALRRDPERGRVVVAEPATVAELAGRWDGA